MHSSKVLIVGAGAAGIAAASKLVENNICDFKILEAENRIGGRVYTSSIDGATVDVGAQWVHGKVNNVVYKFGAEANQLSDLSYDVSKSKYVASCGSFLDDQIAGELYRLSKEILHDKEKLLKFRGSLGDYFIEGLKEKCKHTKILLEDSVLQSFIEWFERFQNSIDGSDSWLETSARGTLEYYECEGNLLTIWKDGGYSKIFELIMGHNHKVITERILFNKIVKTVDWGKKPLRVMCADGSSFTADHVLCSISLGALKENYKTLFVPTLPSKKIQAIKDLGYGTVNKIFLKFPFRWWPFDCPGFNILHRKNALSSNQEGPSWLNEVFAFFSVDSNPLVLCGWVVGSAAHSMELSTDQEVQQACYQLLVKFLGNQYNIPFPDYILRSQWYKNTNFRGSYSFRTVASDDSKVSAADLASPLYLSSGEPGILFAGEATHDHFYSTVHGAIETGWREADRIISYLKKIPNSRLLKSSL